MINLAQKEKKILKFWQKEKIFAKSIEQRQARPFFSFYDGPPFATGKPHYGHILPTTIKDTVLRYWTMRGYQVPRRVGWDCHGLPVENLIEKELGIKDKKEIEKDISRFNKSCRSSVFRCVKDFQTTLEKVGRWADYSNSYATLDNDYIESVWWIFARLWDLGLVYKGHRVTPYCPRCGTPLSNFEVNLGYKDTQEESIYIKFKIAANRYFLVWTTTPWTLPGNVALAVNEKADYAEIAVSNEHYILANQRLSEIDKDYKIVKQHKGKDLLGISYEPLYNFADKTSVKQKQIQKQKKKHYVVSGDFVSLDDGTGIVHIAPAYGEEDMQIGLQNDLPVILNVKLDGTFSDEITPWSGMFVKEADPKIIEDLKKRNLLYKTALTTHTYPFCWRCESPLLYYALDSWYVAVTKFKEQLVKNNRAIHWVPNHLKYGRFGKWLEQAKDWAISRSRFWGAPIPIWQCQKCGKHTVLDSRSAIAEKNGKYNILYLARHAHSEKNINHIASSEITSQKYPLTARGRKEAAKLAVELKAENIDLIISSPLLRCRQTAEIVASKLKVAVQTDDDLKELQFGKYEGLSESEYGKNFRSEKERAGKKIAGVESVKEERQRVEKFAKKINSNFKGKKILVISHGDPLILLKGYLSQLNLEKSLHLTYPQFAQFCKITSQRLDLHRPYIDQVKFKCSCGGITKRISDVFDCWFESGSMPYAQWHYPFDNKKMVENIFPANFISEGLDQTRGWFYTLHVIATALTLKNIGLGKNLPAFRNVIVNGMILDEEGKKLSKKDKNYVAPEAIFDKYGADALRYYLLTATPLGEDSRINEKAIEEIYRRIISTIWNIYVFFDSYVPKDFKINYSRLPQSDNLLDRWILSRLSELNNELVQYLNDYELVKACRLFDGFVDDLSNWYVRRSRSRLQQKVFVDNKKQAATVYGYVLYSLIKLIAPFLPFISEQLYLNMATRSAAKQPLSVHLCDYPKPQSQLLNKNLNSKMTQVRQLVALGLAERSKNSLKVRQPLAKAEIRSGAFSSELMNLIADELNVKKIKVNSKLKSDLVLDTILTPALQEEGQVREIIRQIQDMRKDAKLKPHNKVYIRYSTSEDGHKIIDKWQKDIADQVRASQIEIGSKRKEDFLVEKEIMIADQKLWLGIKKIR